MALQLNFQKSADKLRIEFQKRGINIPSVEMGIGLDVSGSFDDEHCDGLTTILLSRLVPWFMVFDPSQTAELCTFSDGQKNAHYVGEIGQHNIEGYVRKNIINRVPGYNGATDYSYVIERLLQQFGWLEGAPAAQPASGGGLSGWFKKKVAAPVATTSTQKRKSLSIIITDGDNSDKERTRRVLRDSQNRGDGVYFLFLGVSNSPGAFPFIKQLGEEFPNVGFAAITNLRGFANATDEEVTNLLLTQEFLDWVK